MRKILLVIVFALIIIAAIIGFYKSFDNGVGAPAIALKAIPQSAALILETDKAGDLWRDLSQTNLMWEELQATDFYFRLDAAAHAFDSLLTQRKEFRGYLANKPIAISVHVSGARTFDFLISLQVKKGADEATMIADIARLFRGSTPAKREYDGVELYSTDSKLTGSKLFYFQNDGLLVLSKSSILAEESIRALQQNADVLHSDEFMSVRKTRGIHSRAELYVNYKQLKSVLSQNASKESVEMDFFHQPYAAWSALDLKLKPNALSLNGFVLCKDSSEAWIGSFRDSKAPTMKVLRYMPSNTAFFVFLGFGDFQTFRARQMNIYGRTNRKYDIEHKLKTYSDSFGCDMNEYGLDWIGGQAAAFITEPASVHYIQNHFAIFKARNAGTAWDKLCELEKKIAEKSGERIEEETFNDLEIHRLKIGSFYEKVLSESFAGLVDPYFVKMDEMILMGTSLNGMRSLIQKLQQDYESENTLASDKRFLDLSNQISGNSHFLIYSSLARSPFIYQNILSPENAEAIQKQTEILRKFQAFIYQVGYYKNDLYYNNIYFKYNPQFKKETSSLWEKQLKAEVVAKPTLLKNHYTDALEIFVQDVENRIYLISNTGKVLWDQQIDGPVKSEVRQVDVYRNNKLQILFNTEKSIYLLDRNGNNVESYPVKLPAKATNQISIADYDNSRHYRFFIGVEGGKILSYDVSGKQIDGWNYEGASANIVSDVKAIRIKSKDYIFALDKTGKIHLLNRRGKVRIKTDTKVEPRAHGKIAFDLQDNIQNSGIYYVDSLGNAYRQGFNDRFTKIKLTNEPVLDYDFTDIDGDQIADCILLTSNEIEVYKLNGDVIFKNSLDESNRHMLQTFLFPKDVVRIGVTDPENEKITLFENNGKVHSGFPLYGLTPSAIGDMNRDGYFNLITAGKDGFLVAYAIE